MGIYTRNSCFFDIIKSIVTFMQMTKNSNNNSITFLSWNPFHQHSRVCRIVHSKTCFLRGKKFWIETLPEKKKKITTYRKTKQNKETNPWRSYILLRFSSFITGKIFAPAWFSQIEQALCNMPRHNWPGGGHSYPNP